MIFCFVVDTSASMNLVSALNLSLLDAAKSAIERFVKFRSRAKNLEADRYLLVTMGEGREAVKVGWHHQAHEFLPAVKMLQATDMSDLPSALLKAFELLNRYRYGYSSADVDSMCKGRMVAGIDPASVIVLTDNGTISTRAGLLAQNISYLLKGSHTPDALSSSPVPFTSALSLTKSSRSSSPATTAHPNNNSLSAFASLGKYTPQGLPGTIKLDAVEELPYRWDQLVSAVVLEFAGVNASAGDIVTSGPAKSAASTGRTDSGSMGLAPSLGGAHSHNEGYLERLCRRTGGKFLRASSMKSLLQHMEALGHLGIGVMVELRDESSLRNRSRNSSTPPPTPPTPEINYSMDSDSLVSPSSASAGSARRGSSGGGGGSEAHSGSGVSSGSQFAASPSRRANRSRGAWWARPTSGSVFYQRLVGFDRRSTSWPFPDPFLLSAKDKSMPPRPTHPLLVFSRSSKPLRIVAGFPRDRYELEHSRLTAMILKQPSGTVWNVFVPGSAGDPNGLGKPFAYLKANSGRTAVYLLVLPYNYEVLFNGLTMLNLNRRVVSEAIRQHLLDYLSSVPGYYRDPLLVALSSFGLYGVVDHALPPWNPSNSIQEQLFQLKLRADALQSADLDEYRRHGKAIADVESEQRRAPTSAAGDTKTDSGSRLHTATSTGPKSAAARKVVFRWSFGAPKRGVELDIHKGSAVLEHRGKVVSQLDLLRTTLLEQAGLVSPAARMDNLSLTELHHQKLDQDDAHQVPISQMGNYVDVIRKQKRLRNPFLEDSEQSSLADINFGSPYRKRKQSLNLRIVDEAEDEAKSLSSGSPRSRARKRRGPRLPFPQLSPRIKPKDPKKSGKADEALPPLDLPQSAVSGKADAQKELRDRKRQRSSKGDRNGKVAKTSAAHTSKAIDLTSTVEWDTKWPDESVPLESPQWAPVRVEFWQKNKLQHVRTVLTHTLRQRNPDVRSISTMLEAVQGPAPLRQELAALLLAEARDYNQSAIVSCLNKLEKA